MGWDDKTRKMRIDETSWTEASVDFQGRWVEIKVTQQNGEGESNKQVVFVARDYDAGIITKAFRDMVKARRLWADRLEATLDRRA